MIIIKKSVQILKNLSLKFCITIHLDSILTRNSLKRTIPLKLILKINLVIMIIIGTEKSQTICLINVNFIYYTYIDLTSGQTADLTDTNP